MRVGYNFKKLPKEIKSILDFNGIWETAKLLGRRGTG